MPAVRRKVAKALRQSVSPSVVSDFRFANPCVSGPSISCVMDARIFYLPFPLFWVIYPPEVGGACGAHLRREIVQCLCFSRIGSVTSDLPSFDPILSDRQGRNSLQASLTGAPSFSQNGDHATCDCCLGWHSFGQIRSGWRRLRTQDVSAGRKRRTVRRKAEGTGHTIKLNNSGSASLPGGFREAMRP